jgi:starch synthase
MEKTRILFVAQEITPYLSETHMGLIGRHLPQGIQERGKEMRTFMPKYGHINERRNQLHEVIRLSGMNIIINDTDHPLIIKVASIQQARMQVYFIDNEDYFQRKAGLVNKKGEFYKDNDERSIFYCRGVLETVKKLGWPPDVVHCHGWISSLIPLYIKRAMKDNPLFSDTKVIYSLYKDDYPGSFSDNFDQKIILDGINKNDLKYYMDTDYVTLTKSAIHYSDAIIVGQEDVNPEILKYAKETGKPMLDLQPMDNYVDAYNLFYDQLLSGELR